MKRMTKIALPILILGAGFVLMMVLLGMRETPQKNTPKPKVRQVTAETVSLGSIPARITGYGRLASAQPVDLISEVSGLIMAGDVPFKPGQSFSRGDLLVQVDDRQAKLQLNSAKSDLMTALATVLPEIKLDFPDEYRVWQDYFNSCGFDGQLAPLPGTDNQKIKLFLSRFNIYKLYFQVRDLEITLDKHYFRAPFDGSIVSADLREGASVRSGSVLGQLINLEQLEVEVPVSIVDIPWVERGRQVTFASAEIPGRWTGRIIRVGSDIDTRTQTVPVYISIDGEADDALINGVFLTADIPGRTIDRAVSVPRKALYDDRFVYVITDGKLEYREVNIARRENDVVIVDGGLSDGDTLVVELMQAVTDGMPAKPIMSDTRETDRI